MSTDICLYSKLAKNICGSVVFGGTSTFYPFAAKPFLLELILVSRASNSRLCLLVGLILGPAEAVRAQEAESALFTKAESFSYSAANPVTAFLSMLVGPEPQPGGTHVFSRNSIEFGVRHEALSFSIIHRNDYNLDFTPDAAAFSYLTRNNLPVPLDQFYDVEVWANQYQVTGIKIAYEIPLSDSFKASVGYSHLYATEAVSGYMGKNPDGSGGVVRLVEQQLGGQPTRMLDGELYTDYFFTSDPLFRRPADAPTGQGFAIDLGFKWQLTPHWQLYGQFDDVVAEIRWRNMPHIEASATSETVVVDEDGLLRALPYFDGQQTQRDFRQDLTERQRLGVQYQNGPYVLGYDFDRMPARDFNWLRAGYHWGNRWGVQLAMEVEVMAAQLTLISPAGPISLTLDNLDIDNAHTLGVSWALSFAL